MPPNSPRLGGRGVEDDTAKPSSTPDPGVSVSTTNTWEWDPLRSSAVDTREQDAISEAIKRSLRDSIPQANAPAAPVRHTVSAAATAAARSANLVFCLNNEFPVLDDPKGDTVIYIGAPPRMPEQSEKDYQYVCHHFDQVHVVQSATLKRMGPESKFTDRDLLGPKSVRSERKLRKLGVLADTEQKRGSRFRYYIDLRPPREDDEAVVLITDLSCTRGVLAWHLATDKYQLPTLAVGGFDDFGADPPRPQRVASVAEDACKVKDETSEAPATLPSPVKVSVESKDNPDPDKPKEVPPRPTLAPEYSPLRHWSAIERLLHAMHGSDPKLDSAPKVWTFFAIARYFGCAHHERIANWITAWIYNQSNVHFVQNNPEVAYSIGMGIRAPDLVKGAFSILVGEKALLNVYGEFDPAVLSPPSRSVHGRKVELLDDDERNRIDHAASAFVARIRTFACDTFRDMDWLRRCDGYTSFEDTRGLSPRQVDEFASRKQLVKDFVRSRIYYVLCQDQDALGQLEPYPESTRLFRSATIDDYAAVYNKLNQPMRLFTKTFWHALERTNFEADESTALQGTCGRRTVTPYMNALRDLYAQDPVNGIKSIALTTVRAEIALCNHAFVLRDARSNPVDRPCQHALPRTKRATSSSSSASDSDSSPPRPRKSRAVDSRPGKRVDTAGANGSGAGLAIRTRAFAESEEGVSSSFSPRNLPVSDLAIRLKSQGSAPPEPIVLAPRTSLNLEPGSDLRHWRALVPKPSSEANTVQRDIADPPVTFSSAPRNDNVSSSSSISAPDGQQSSSAAEPATSTFADPTTVSRCTPHPSNEAPPTDPWWNTDAEIFISPFILFDQITDHMSRICSGLLEPAHLFHQTGVLPTDLCDNLLCLTANEFQYLPLWVPDGLDDGTGGVFDECPVPNLDLMSEDFELFAAGRIKRPYSARSETDSSVEDVASAAISTVGRASKDATNGTETVRSVSSKALDSHSTAGGLDTDAVMVDDVFNGISVIEDDVGSDADSMGAPDDVDLLDVGDTDEDGDTDTDAGIDAVNNYEDLDTTHDRQASVGDVLILSSDDLGRRVNVATHQGDALEHNAVSIRRHSAVPQAGADVDSDSSDDSHESFEWIA